MNVTIPNKWTPRWYQLPLLQYFDKGGRYAVLKWSRRLGKDDVCLHETARRAMLRKGNYLYTLPKYEQARLAIWDAVDSHTGQRRIDWVFPKEIRKSTNESEMKIVFVNGSTWKVCGSDSYDTLVGNSCAGVVFSEYALCKPEAWGYLKPILDENKGWAIFNSTVRGQNHFTDLAHYAEQNPEWFYSNVQAGESGVFTREQLEEIKQEYIGQYGNEQGLGMFLQEYENDENAFIATFNAVFSHTAGEFMRTEPAPNVPVICRVAGIDLARFGGDNNVIFVADKRDDGSMVEKEVVAWNGTDAVFSQGKIAEVLARSGVKQCSMDADGVGGPILDNVRALCNGRAVVFEEYHNTALPATDPYANKTTRGYFALARDAEQGKVFIRDKRVLSELGSRMYEFNTKGQRVLQQKKEWRKESGKSPDFADAAVMAGMITPLPANFLSRNATFARTEYDVI